MLDVIIDNQDGCYLFPVSRVKFVSCKEICSIEDLSRICELCKINWLEVD